MYSERLQEVIKSGVFRVDRKKKKKKAEIVIPDNEDEVTGDDWIELLRIGREAREELERAGYTVTGENYKGGRSRMRYIMPAIRRPWCSHLS
jgi:hypothetical protein